MATMLEDDAWAWERMRSHADIEECSSFRVELDGVVHRFVTMKKASQGGLQQRWHSLCGIRPEKCPPSIDKPVDCVGCLAEGA